jgi:hypothetical protein
VSLPAARIRAISSLLFDDAAFTRDTAFFQDVLRRLVAWAILFANLPFKADFVPACLIRRPVQVSLRGMRGL